MTTEDMRNPIGERSSRGRHTKPARDSIMCLRQWLNAIFMIGAIVGMGIYFFSDEFSGTIVILVSMAFKIVECTLRFIHK